VLAKTRAHELTFSSFKRRLLDELNGDLALALTIDERYDYTNPFWQHAKYCWVAPDFSDYGEGFDLAQRWLCRLRDVAPPDWRSMLRIKGLWQGGIQSPDPQPSAASVLLFCRWLLLHGLQQDEVLNHYDRFVITRSDFVWLCPHPPLSVLDRSAIWLPDGEHYGGLTDRHLVVSRSDVENCLNLIEDVVLHPFELYEEMKHRPEWNIERFIAHHLRRKGLIDKVRLFPYVMYTARSMRDSNVTWSPGYYEPTVDHLVKYEREFRLATAYATVIHSRADWENRSWVDFDPKAVSSAPVSLSQKIRYAWVRFYYSWLMRPDRGARLVRFCMRMANRTVGRMVSVIREGINGHSRA
jgi:hypothetical protein